VLVLRNEELERSQTKMHVVHCQCAKACQVSAHM